MITRLNGVLLEKTPGCAVIDIHGIAYEVFVSMQTFFRLPESGQNILLHIQMVVRDDAHILYGFDSREERAVFRQVQKVGGIGAKIALAVLSALTPDELAGAVETADVRRLSSVPGIGKKTAERMILELRGKLAADGAQTPAADNGGAREEVAQALLSLGYSEREIRAVVRNLPPDTDIGEGVRTALRQLSS